MLKNKARKNVLLSSESSGKGILDNLDNQNIEITPYSISLLKIKNPNDNNHHIQSNNIATTDDKYEKCNTGLKSYISTNNLSNKKPKIFFANVEDSYEEDKKQ